MNETARPASPRPGPGPLRRLLAGVQIGALLLATSCLPEELSQLPEPRAGELASEQRLVLDLPWGRVHLGGGNLAFRRLDLSIDTRLGTRELSAVFNAASARWLHSFDIRYDGARFLDASGLEHDLSGVANGEVVPGSVWRRLSDRAIRHESGLVYEFGPSGVLASLRRSSASYPRLVYDPALVAGEERVVAIRDCRSPTECDPVATITRHVFGVLRIDDRAGRQVRLLYDSRGRLRVARSALDVEEGWPGQRYEYQSAFAGGRLTAVTSSEDERVEYEYAAGRLVALRRVGPGDPTYSLQYGWDAERSLAFARVENPLGRPCTFYFDPERRFREMRNAVGEVVTLAWDAAGRPIEEVAQGRTTRWSHPAPDVVIETTPAGNVIETRFADGASDREGERPILSVEDSLGVVLGASYDAQGRRTELRNGAGEAVRYTYGADQQLATVELPTGARLHLGDYSVAGHPRSVAWEIHGQLRSESRSYDPVGNQLTGADFWDVDAPGRPGVVARGFDAGRHLRRLDLRSRWGAFYGEVQSLEIDVRSDGQRTRIRRPLGGDTELEYDALGRLVERRERVDGDWTATRYAYDAADNLVAVELANGLRQERVHDAVNRLAELRWLRAGAVEKRAFFAYEQGRLATIWDSVHGFVPESHQQDAAGRTIRIVYPGGESLERDLDVRGRETALRFVHGGLLVRAVARTYDPADRERRLELDGELLRERSYAGGRRVEERFGNGLVRARIADPSAGTVAWETTDALGGIVARTDAMAGPCIYPSEFHCVGAYTEAFVEGAVRLAHEVYLEGPLPENGEEGARILGSAVGSDAFGNPTWLPGTPGSRWFEYDALGNLRASGFSELENSRYHQYNAEGNRLLAIHDVGVEEHVYGHDAAGFTTWRDGLSLAWDASGRIASVGEEHRFVWDSLGRPVEATTAGQTTYHAYGGIGVGFLPGQPAMLELDGIRFAVAGGLRRYSHPDFRGNTAMVSDEYGELLVLHQYDAYGLAASYGSGEASPSRFAGGVAIGETGLVVLGARVYDEAAGRFLSADPVYQTVNQFAYAEGNPVSLWDPDGAQASVAGSDFGPGQAGVGLAGAGTGVLAAAGLSAAFGAPFLAAVLLGIGLALIFVGVILIVGALAAGSELRGLGAVTASGIGCAPAPAAQAPDPRWWLGVLLPLHVLLTLAIRRSERGRRAEPSR